MSKYSEEWDYKCPRCSSDDTDIIEQQDLIDNFNNKVIGIERSILCNECSHEWMRKHRYRVEESED